MIWGYPYDFRNLHVVVIGGGSLRSLPGLGDARSLGGEMETYAWRDWQWEIPDLEVCWENYANMLTERYSHGCR